MIVESQGNCNIIDKELECKITSKSVDVYDCIKKNVKKNNSTTGPWCLSD